jgi:myxalamid-type polyketide synthase MxaE and MxaD
VQGRASSAFVLALGAASVDERRQLLETHLQTNLAAVLKVPASKIDPLRPLGTLGLESLLALEFRNRLERSVGLKLPATMVWNHPTVRALATYVAGRLGVELDGAAGDARPSVTPAAATASRDVDDLSDEQALRALLAGR